MGRLAARGSAREALANDCLLKTLLPLALDSIEGRSIRQQNVSHVPELGEDKGRTRRRSLRRF